LHGLEHAKLALVATLFVAFKLPLTMIAYELEPELALTGFDRPTISTVRLVRKLELIASPRADDGGGADPRPERDGSHDGARELTSPGSDKTAPPVAQRGRA
jgi:hypothetical protein